MANSQWISQTRQAALRSAALARAAGRSTAESAGVFLRDVGHGMLEVSHNTLALLGFLLAAAVLFIAGRADLRHEVETRALGWLQARHEARLDPALSLAEELSEPDAIARATASDPKGLNRQPQRHQRLLAVQPFRIGCGGTRDRVGLAQFLSLIHI